MLVHQQQEVFLTSRVSHIVRDRGPTGGEGAGGVVGAAPCRRREGRARADAMLQRVHPSTHIQLRPNCVHLTVQKVTKQLNLYFYLSIKIISHSQGAKRSILSLNSSK